MFIDGEDARKLERSSERRQTRPQEGRWRVREHMGYKNRRETLQTQGYRQRTQARDAQEDCRTGRGSGELGMYDNTKRKPVTLCTDLKVKVHQQLK